MTNREKLYKLFIISDNPELRSKFAQNIFNNILAQDNNDPESLNNIAVFLTDSLIRNDADKFLISLTGYNLEEFINMTLSTEGI